MGLIFRVVVMMIALSGIVYTMYQLNTRGINKEVFHLQEEGLSFNPADVKKFEWRTRDKISSLEKNPSGQWIPFERELQIKAILKNLAILKLNALEQKNVAQILVHLEVAAELWIGQWDGQSFLWTQGPLKGQGAILTEEFNKMFFRGRYVFDPDIEVKLCQNRVNKIRVTLESKEYVIAQEKRGWTLTYDKTHKSIDPIFIEKWLIKACPLKVQTTIDPAYAPQVPRVVNRLSLFYIDQTQYDFFSLEKDLVMANDRALLLSGYATLFGELKAEIEKVLAASP